MSSRLAGQTINDRFLAAKHSLAGQGLAKAVCKATTEELIGPKKKHLDYLVHCTNEPNVSIPQLANLLIERSQNTNWVVVYKALITVHHLMCYGNERFTQYLASSNSTFQLSNFFDKSGVQGYDMSPFIRKYSRYLNEKAISCRTVAFDFCKIKRGKEDGALRTMHPDKLLKTLPSLQSQLDALLEFDCSANDLTNGVINMSFMLLFRDLIRLFASCNDGIINLLEKFFDMNKKQCKEGIDIYKKFLIRMDRVAEFLKVAENVGIDKGDIPDLTKAPSSLLDALEQHLSGMEGKKSSTSSGTPASQNASNQRNVKSAVTALSSTSSSFGTVVTNGRFDSNGIDEHLKQQLLAEEEAAMNQFKSKVQSPTANNPFLSNNSTSASSTSPGGNGGGQPALDLFLSEPLSMAQIPTRASDDLLQLNPFADVFPQHHQQHSRNTNAWIAAANGGNSYTNVVNVSPHPVISNGAFVSETNFQTVFGNSETKNFDAGGVLQPTSLQGDSKSSPNSLSSTANTTNSLPGSALLTGDLESSLASLAENLTITNRPAPIKEIQWNSPKNGSKMGSSWSPQPISATTGAGYKPMNQSMPQSFIQQPIYPPPPTTATSMPPPMMGMRPIISNPAAMMPQRPGMTTAPPTNNSMAQQSLLFH